MNCRPGDLAVLIKSTQGYEGAIVEVVSWAGDYEFRNDCTAASWLCKVPSSMEWMAGHQTPAGHLHIPDSWLKPLRNDPGTDETLEWKSLPSPHKEMAE
jgi:hypothetical protein